MHANKGIMKKNFIRTNIETMVLNKNKINHRLYKIKYKQFNYSQYFAIICWIPVAQRKFLNGQLDVCL